MIVTLINNMGLFLIFAHVPNLGIRHSPEYITTALGGGFLRHIKDLLKTMGATLDIESKKGSGTTVSIIMGV